MAALCDSVISWILVNYHCNVSFSFRFMRALLILVVYLICLSAKRNSFVTLSYCQYTLTALVSMACWWIHTDNGWRSAMSSGSGWWGLVPHHFNLYVIFKEQFYHHLLIFQDFLLRAAVLWIYHEHIHLQVIYPRGSLLQNISAPHHRGSQHVLIIMYTCMIWQKEGEMEGSRNTDAVKEIMLFLDCIHFP
jgi:hypothetical protein